MFHIGLKQDEIEFSSNPPLDDAPRIRAEKDEVTGNFKNVVSYVPRSNRSFFDGVRYNPETMSLRALLNLGVKLTPVAFGVTENDPTKINAAALRMEQSIQDRLNKLSADRAAAVGVNPDVVPSNND